MKKILLLFFIPFLACSSGTWEAGEPPEALNDEALTSLSEKSFWFGHKSVGENILQGMEEVLKEKGNPAFKIKETVNPADMGPGVLAHAKIGENNKPETKMQGFLDSMDQVSSSVDFATFKFCFYDFDFDTNVEQVFKEYKDTVALFKEKHPDVRYFHMTAPLFTPTGGFGAAVKRNLRGLLGKPQWGYDDNIKRAHFNKLLLDEYTGVDPVFDIARVESTAPDGRRYFLSKKGEKFNALIKDYTSDGGHLNEKGRKVMARQFLKFLADL